jgi:RimJ/RimL family protein N-acetyltransferase
MRKAGTLPALNIVSLADVPRYLDVVAERLWRAWWEPYGETLEDVQAELAAVLKSGAYPFTLVAVLDGHFAGTVTAIDGDIFERPELSPCLAALWIEEWARGQGIARALVAELTKRLEDIGQRRVYLSAKPHLLAFYENLGWAVIEKDFGAEYLIIFASDLPPPRSHDTTN